MASFIIPSFPRALFIACMAVAGAASATLRPAPIRSATLARIERRDKSLRHYIRGLGLAIIAAGRAKQTFEQAGAMWTPPSPPVLKLDPRLAAIAASAELVSQIGELDGVDAWAEVSEDPPRVSLLWRGELVREGSEAVREHSAEQMRAAAIAAAAALDAAGFPTSGLIDVRWLQTRERDGATLKFKGYVATIGLRRARPVWAVRLDGKGHARTA